MRPIRTCLLIALLLSTIGCATSPNLTRFSEEAILRKPVLPEGVASWRVLGGTSFDGERNSTVFPFYWEQGLSDRFTWVWTPIPVDLRYLAWEDAEAGRWLVLEASLLGSPYSREKNFDWRPSLSAKARARVNDWSALDLGALAQVEVKRSASERLSRSTGLRAGGFFQPTAKLGAGVGIWLMNEKGSVRARYLGELPPASTDPTSSSRWRYPLEAELHYVVNAQWTFLLQGQLDRLGYEQGYTGSSAYLSIVHLW